MKTIIYNSIEFTQIKDYEDYYVSRCGKILSNKFNKFKILKLKIDKSGYKHASLNQKYYLVHRLVGLTFIFNHLNKPCINKKRINLF